MTEKVRVIRYVRTKNGKQPWIYNNLGGATMVFDMNYTDRMVDVYLAVCHPKDNFCKKTGIEQALGNGIQRVLSLDKFQSFANQEGIEGFVKAYHEICMTAGIQNATSDVEEKLIERFDIIA